MHSEILGDMRDTPQRIAIIGAGQLGSRHLQGLTKIKQVIQITMIDSNPSALEIARQRFIEMPENPLIQSVAYLDSLEEFDEPVELAIIATNADQRRNVIEELVSNSRVKYLILEKVVFQSVADFKVVMSLLKKNNINSLFLFGHKVARFIILKILFFCFNRCICSMYEYGQYS